MTRSFSRVCSQPWLITQDALGTIIEIARRENPTPEAVAARLGRPLDNSHTVTMRDGTAIVPITGPIFRRASLLTAVSGATATGTIAKDIQAAVQDASVRNIVLEIDSPGGEASGISELAAQIHAASQQKPITAYVDGMGASAAYWIAAAANEIVISDTAILGSIGVVMAMQAGTDEDEIEFVSSQSPKKRVDPTTKAGKAEIQTLIDDLADVFVSSVAQYRGVSADTVLSDFGQGGVFVGAKAVDAGLADRVGSFESLLTSFSSPLAVAGPTAQTTQEEISMADQENITPTAGTIDTQQLDVNVAHPDGSSTQYNVVEAAGRIEELEDALATMTAERDSLTARVLELETGARREELRTIAAAWHGDTEAHVTFMETLTPEAREHFVTTMNAATAQAAASTDTSIFEPVGATVPEESRTMSIEDRRKMRTAELVKEGKSHTQATRQALKEITV